VDTDDDRPVETIRVRRADRHAPLLVVLVAAGFALAVLKPWEGSARTRTVSPVVPSAAVAVAGVGVTPAALAAPTLSPAQVVAQEARDRRQCQSGIGWRVVTMEQTGGRPTRTLLMVAPTKLPSTPTDPLIPTAVLYAQRLFGIGFCQPSSDDRGAVVPSPRVAIWAIPRTGAPIPEVQPITLDAGLASIGESYFGPPSAAATDQWAAGRYVFAVQTDESNALPAWFALEYRDTRTADAGDPQHAAP
jgi:hypothetical protein